MSGRGWRRWLRSCFMGGHTAILNLDDHRTSAVRLLGLDSLRSQIQAPTAGFGPPFGRRRERQGAHRNHVENCWVDITAS